MNTTTLNNLPLCHRAYMSSVNSEGAMRRRLLDFGFAPGNAVTSVLKSPLGDPTAYEIMGSMVALRADSASLINITNSTEAIDT